MTTPLRKLTSALDKHSIRNKKLEAVCAVYRNTETGEEFFDFATIAQDRGFCKEKMKERKIRETVVFIKHNPYICIVNVDISAKGVLERIR